MRYDHSHSENVTVVTFVFRAELIEYAGKQMEFHCCLIE